MLPLVGCGVCGAFSDRCERLCCDVSRRVETCIQESPSLVWEDLGVVDRQGFARACAGDWNDLGVDLSNHELQEAVKVCRDTREALSERAELGESPDDDFCQELIAKYAGGV